MIPKERRKRVTSKATSLFASLANSWKEIRSFLPHRSQWFIFRIEFLLILEKMIFFFFFLYGFNCCCKIFENICHFLTTVVPKYICWHVSHNFITNQQISNMNKAQGHRDFIIQSSLIHYPYINHVFDWYRETKDR